MRTFICYLLLLTPIGVKADLWGFFAHQKINRTAVFTLPPEMIDFYKHHLDYLTEKSVNPDKRRYILKNEGVRHYIDLEHYGDSAAYKMPRYWKQAVELYSKDSLNAYGIAPYHIARVSNWLIMAFENRDPEKILRISADIGHYIADANVPLHTTKNYNGQLTDQVGIHGFWESRLPELFFEEYDLFTGRATYVPDIQQRIWDAIINAHEALDSVFLFEKQLTQKYAPSKKYSIEEKGLATSKTYSYKFSRDYHRRLGGMVERRIRASIKMVGDIWFSCWVKAGQPQLKDLLDQTYAVNDSTYSGKSSSKLRNHETGSEN